jgi:hypothetical protein
MACISPSGAGLIIIAFDRRRRVRDSEDSGAMEKLTDAELRQEWLAFKSEIAEHMQLYGCTSAFNAAHIQKLKAEMERRGLCLV